MNLIRSMSELDIIASELRFDTDTYELRDGYALTLHADPDPDASVFDEDECFLGKLAEVTYTYGGQDERPSGFDGAARIVDGYRGERYWWQPPADMPTEAYPQFIRWIKDRLEWGYAIVWVELNTPDGDYQSNCLGMVDEISSDIVGEMIGEVVEDWTRDFEAAGRQLVERILAGVGA